MRNLTMLTDLYQLTMMNGYFNENLHEQTAVFDLFFRKTSGESAYAIMAGLEQVIELCQNICFSKNDIEYLESLSLFSKPFLKYLETLKFTGDLFAMPEGTVVFPVEPLIRVKAPLIQGQLIETAMLNLVNHQTLIATKASRIVHAADGDEVIEMGLRRAQGPDAGVFGSRAAFIGGCNSTSNVYSGKAFNIPVRGSHAHSWVMSFQSEIEAFFSYAKTYPDACILLVDTVDTIRSGLPNAIIVFNELRKKGHEPVGIRLDSGDIAYLSQKARQMLDEAGFENVKILASNDLDEKLIRDLKSQGAKIDFWGVGTKLITSDDCPALGGVYKLAAFEKEGQYIPKMKLSDNVSKMTNPGCKKVYRIYGKQSKKALADLIVFEHEKIDETKPLKIYHPNETWKTKTINEFYVKELLEKIFVGGVCVYQKPTLRQIQEYAKNDLKTFWPEYKRALNPHIYKVDISDELYDVKQTIIRKLRKF